MRIDHGRRVKTGGSPEVGPQLKTRFTERTIDRLDQVATATGVSRAVLIRLMTTIALTILEAGDDDRTAELLHQLTEELATEAVISKHSVTTILDYFFTSQGASA